MAVSMAMTEARGTGLLELLGTRHSSPNPESEFGIPGAAAAIQFQVLV
jgi:hypothetical protein